MVIQQQANSGVSATHPSSGGLPDDGFFDHDKLRKAAEQKAGYDDYGSDSYLDALESLLYSMKHEAELNALGRQEIFNRIAAALANRLTVVAWEKANPALAAAPIEAPMFVLGLARTGSSILHETIAAIPSMRTPLIWQVRDFSLVHKVVDAGADERVRKIDEDIARKNQIVEGYAAMHFEAAHIPMECVMLTILNLVSVQFATIAFVPTYRKYLLSLDALPTYDWHRRALRYLQAASPGKRWILKAPMHSLYIDAMTRSYPDAMIIQTHRNPLEVIGSNCSLAETLRRPWSDRTDVSGQAASDTAYTAESVRRAVRFRAAHPEIDAKIYDVAFKSFISGQVETLEKIHVHFGLPFTEEARQAVANYTENRPREKYGKHKYTLEQFGLKPEEVAAQFSEYTTRFGTFL